MKKLMLAFAAGGALALTGCQQEGGERDLGETETEVIEEENTFEDYQDTESVREEEPTPTREEIESEASEATEGSETGGEAIGGEAGTGMGEEATSGEETADETAPAEEQGGTETGEAASGETDTAGDPGGADQGQQRDAQGAAE